MNPASQEPIGSIVPSQPRTAPPDTTKEKSLFGGADNLTRWFIPTGVLLTLVGYWGPWINHASAGLIVAGLDLAEYVKFLPPVRQQDLALQREGFYLPLITTSLLLSLAAFRARFRYSYWVRLGLVVLAMTAAANLLPPAWSPGILFTPEFRLQTAIMVVCWVTALLSPFAALLPLLAARSVATILIAAALIVPLQLFVAVWPAIGEIYHAPLQLGWGPFLLAPGLILALAGWWLAPNAPMPTGIEWPTCHGEHDDYAHRRPNQSRA
jgi:hypothetical protein